MDSKIPSLDNCYCSGIIDATSKVKYEAVFQGLVLSVSNFEGIVKAGSQVERLSLWACTIDTSPDLDFSGPLDFK